MSTSVRRLEGAAVASLVLAVGVGISAFIAPSGLATAKIQAAAVLAATGGWLYNNAIGLKIKLREKAYSFIDSDIVAHNLTNILRPIVHFFIINSDCDWKKMRARCRVIFSYKYDDEGLVYQLLRAGDMFENMAILIRRDSVDEEIIKDYFEGTFQRFFERFAIFLGPIRNLPSWSLHCKDHPVRPNVAEHMEWLYIRWFGKQVATL